MVWPSLVLTWLIHCYHQIKRKSSRKYVIKTWHETVLSIYLSAFLSVDQSIGWSVVGLVGWWLVGYLIGWWWVGWSVSWSVSGLFGRLVVCLVFWSIGLSVGPSVGFLVSWMIFFYPSMSLCNYQQYSVTLVLTFKVK